MKIATLLFLIICAMYGASIDKSWFDNNQSQLESIYLDQYKKTTEQIKNKSYSSEQKEHLDYQLVVLKKLQESVQNSDELPLKNVGDINTSSSFIKALHNYVAIHDFYLEQKDELKNNEKRVQALEEQIDKIENSDDVVLLNAQLLYGYFMLQNRAIDKQISLMNSILEDEKKVFLNALTSVKININSKIDAQLSESQELIGRYIKDERSLLLSLDKAQMTQNENRVKALEIEITNVKSLKQKEIQKLLWLKIEKFLPILQSKNSDFFELFKDFQSSIEIYELNFEPLIELFKYLSREHIGITKTTLSDTKQSFLDIFAYGWREVNHPYIPVGNGISLLDIVQFILIFIIGFSIASFYRHRIVDAIKYINNSSPSAITMLSNLGYYFLVIITFMIAMKSVGIDLSSLTILAGALSVGIGFGLQNIVSNFISGIILIFEKSIQIGNIIELDSGARGKVTQINMRSSVITTFDNVDIIVPNSTFIQNNVVNLTLTDDLRRLNIPFGVAYGSDIDKVIEIILNALDENSELVYIKNDPDKHPKVWMNTMGASSLDMSLLVWVDSNNKGASASTLSDFLIFVYKTLQANNIVIPFPQLDLHIKKEEVLV